MSEKMTDRFFGVVTFWRADKGFGFAKPDISATAYSFTHRRSEKQAYQNCPGGQRVSYELGPDRNGKAMAVNVELIGS
jgi:cold shock CspA family protein